eukprot:TRINITY_DN4465_c0_g2_i1.p1 TRINITY_DN4465_c0_g2~~TRINITY_DN4465_c0_g2_i1.p1  ORF type:complete len:346 (-),score=111.84 TRINITY_DN4465_c0_g2_i1:14-1051(-)
MNFNANQITKIRNEFVDSIHHGKHSVYLSNWNGEEKHRKSLVEILKSKVDLLFRDRLKLPDDLPPIQLSVEGQVVENEVDNHVKEQEKEESEDDFDVRPISKRKIEMISNTNERTEQKKQKTIEEEDKTESNENDEHNTSKDKKRSKYKQKMKKFYGIMKKIAPNRENAMTIKQLWENRELREEFLDTRSKIKNDSERAAKNNFTTFANTHFCTYKEEGSRFYWYKEETTSTHVHLAKYRLENVVPLIAKIAPNAEEAKLMKEIWDYPGFKQTWSSNVSDSNEFIERTKFHRWLSASQQISKVHQGGNTLWYANKESPQTSFEKEHDTSSHQNGSGEDSDDFEFA